MKRFNWTIFISFNLFFTFLLMALSGIILYFKPEGTIARWLDWDILWLDKSGWESLHTVFSFLFMAFALFHILKIHLFNLRVYFLKFRSRDKARELYLSLMITVLFTVGTVMMLPPFHSIYQGGNHLSALWKNRVEVADQGVSPRISLEKAAAGMGMNGEALAGWIDRQEDLEDLSPEASLMANARGNDVTPYGLYQRLKREAVGRDRSQRLYGSITLEELGLILEVPSSRIQAFLRHQYDLHEVAPSSDLLELSRRADQKPAELKKAIVEGLSGRS